MTLPTILVVCTANQCRSPAAAALLQRHLPVQDPNREWRILSAGVWAHENLPADARMCTVAAEWGLDLEGHRSRSVDQELLAASHLVLTMEVGQCEALRSEFPAYAQRIHCFAELIGIRYDIADPIGRSVEVYRATLRELERIVSTGGARLAEMI